jgi:hypothetical protein
VPNKARSANQGKRYVSRLGDLVLCTNMIIQVLETMTKEEKEKTWLCAANSSSAWHTGLSGGAPDRPVSQRSPAPTVGRAIFV